MTPRDFCYWLQGYVEIVDPTGTDPGGLPLQPEQIKCIRQHLGYVFDALNKPAPVTYLGQQSQQDAFHLIGGAKVC
jgi:hypothetical protein